MTDKELRKLGRADLLEMLLNQSRKNDENSERMEDMEVQLAEMTKAVSEKDAELEALKVELAEYKERALTAEAKVEDKTIALNKAGSIAEAAVQINGVLEAAEAAARQYLDNIQMLNARQEQVLKDREEEHLAMCRRMLADTQAECDSRKAKAREEAEGYWTAMNEKLEQFCSSHAGMAELLQVFEKKPAAEE